MCINNKKNQVNSFEYIFVECYISYFNNNYEHLVMDFLITVYILNNMDKVWNSFPSLNFSQKVSDSVHELMSDLVISKNYYKARNLVSQKVV